jgi:hypothetical protein
MHPMSVSLNITLFKSGVEGMSFSEHAQPDEASRAIFQQKNMRVGKRHARKS